MMQGAIGNAAAQDHPPAQMTGPELPSGPATKRLFLTGMIQHHEGALAMVGGIFRRGRRSWVGNNLRFVHARGCRPRMMSRISAPVVGQGNQS